ncbi:TMEM175 family protein [Duganella qianjiadongensis]|uniref:DUF1211 domain-containing protein n=1 Tax=Duganella qianjiadongensis TaxID=2692176 RepID=A0ABW9VR87_9BURK|nr:TMEM175 family protein [Duganella qianjiadongensis]MYM41460.1 DUF1211 domain-containing protein [Duganella qianjiadongensis]
MSDSVSTTSPQLSKHRIEALADGIFAVAMTLLVIDLRIPEAARHAGEAALRNALLELLPNMISWLISFFVLANFWIANHRLYSFVRQVDQSLLWLTMLVLSGASLLPFASAVDNQFASLTGQAVYSGVMVLLGSATLLQARYIYRHPELCSHSFDPPAYAAVMARSLGLIVIALSAIPLSITMPGKANLVFFLMAGLRPLGSWAERRSAQKAA